MSTEVMAVVFCGLCCVSCLGLTMVNVKLFTEWVKHGILKK